MDSRCDGAAGRRLHVATGSRGPRNLEKGRWDIESFPLKLELKQELKLELEKLEKLEIASQARELESGLRVGTDRYGQQTQHTEFWFGSLVWGEVRPYKTLYVQNEIGVVDDAEK